MSPTYHLTQTRTRAKYFTEQGIGPADATHLALAEPCWC